MGDSYNGQPSPGAGIDINRSGQPAVSQNSAVPILPPNVVPAEELVRRRAIADALRKAGK